VFKPRDKVLARHSVCLHAFDGRLPFNEETRRKIGEIKRVYGLDLDASASHQLIEKADGRG
jgi:hypothetical protein